MKAGVIYQNLKTKITASEIVEPLHEPMYKVECLNLDKDVSTVWFTVFSGNTVQVIRFLNAMVKSVNSIEPDTDVRLNNHLVMKTSIENNVRYLHLFVKKAQCFYTRDQLVDIRDSFLKHLKDI